MTSILLPSDQDTAVTISIGDKEVTAELTELETLLLDAEKLAREMSTHWSTEFPALFKAKYSYPISTTQALFLNIAVNRKMDELKKKLLGGLETLKTPESPSAQKPSKKPTGSKKPSRQSKRKKS